MLNLPQAHLSKSPQFIFIRAVCLFHFLRILLFRPLRLRGNEIEQTTTAVAAATTTETVYIQFGMQEMIHLSYDILRTLFIGIYRCRCVHVITHIIICVVRKERRKYELAVRV